MPTLLLAALEQVSVEKKIVLGLSELEVLAKSTDCYVFAMDKSRNVTHTAYLIFIRDIDSAMHLHHGELAR